MWSRMRRSETTHNPHLTVEKESEASIELLSLRSTDEMTARSKCKCQCFGFQDSPEDVGKWWVRKWVIFSKELATCDDGLGLSAIWMKGSTHVEARRKVFTRLLCCPTIEGCG